MAVDKREYTIQVPDIIGGGLEYFQTHHALMGIDQGTLIRWAAFIAVWVIVAFWHQHQNRAFHEYIRNRKQRTPLSDRLSQLAYNRAYELLGLFFVLILIVIFYDTRVFKAESALQTAHANAIAHESEVRMLEERVASLEAELEEARELSGLPEDIEQSLDNIKRKYENLFVSYYYLKRCNAIEPRDFHLMNSGLIYELTELNAPAGVRKRILTAAKGTHDELYVEAPCTPEAIGPMQEEVSAYVANTVASLPDY